MSKLTVKELILEEINKSQRGCAEKLAKISGYYSSGTNLTRVLRDPKKEFDNLNALIRIVRYLFEDDEKKLMQQYSNEVDVNNKSARHMLEYLSSNRLLDSMKNLIDRMAKCKNRESREYAKVYRVQYQWHKDYYSLDVKFFIKLINEIKTNVIELNVYLYLLKFYAAYHDKNYVLAKDFSDVVALDVDNIKDEYIKNAYKSRYNEVLSYIYLRVYNNPVESRKKSKEVLNSEVGSGAIAYAHYTIGCSYLFTSYDKSLENLNKSIEVYQSTNRKSAANDVKEKVDLLNVIWEKSEDIYTITAKLLQEAKRGNLQESSLIRFKDEIEKSFYYLVRGIKDDDNDHLLLSFIEFIKTGDTYLGNLPKFELLKKGYNKEILNALTELNQY
jgi:hypothetical protein